MRNGHKNMASKKGFGCCGGGAIKTFHLKGYLERFFLKGKIFIATQQASITF